MKRHYSLFSQDSDLPVCWFEKFDKEAIKGEIIEHLKANMNDTIELCKEYKKTEIESLWGMEIIAFYANNPKTGRPSKVITKGNKDYYKQLTA